MYVDISALGNDLSVVEKIDFISGETYTIDDYGNEINDSPTRVSCSCIVVDKSVNVLDSSRGIYVKNSFYDIYVPTSFVSGNKIDEGDKIVRTVNNKTYQIVSEPTIKPYASHCIMRVAEERFE